ncbi:YdcH family protein [Sulfuriflexus mobilis]|uniref:YdcH family protein n=1 Tax=Sulfuriflexus mobilis TaxID=1811807 RepID=UPI000F83E61B|nr:DUF465 domain-containing protein [Sulfuriflexus mobilis]
MNDEQVELQNRIEQLKLEHRDLDEVISRLHEQGLADQLQLRRMKKRKLVIKDILQRLKSQLIPDMDA